MLPDGADGGDDVERVVEVRFSPDGRLLASSSTDGSVKLWDYREGRLARLFTNQLGNWVRRLAFSPDGRWLVPASYDGKVSVWDTVSGAVTRTIRTMGRGNTAREARLWLAGGFGLW